MQEISFPVSVTPFRKDGILHKLHTIRTGVLSTLAQSSKRSPLNHHVFVLLTRALGSSLISRETSWNGFLYDISQYNMSKHEIKLAKNYLKNCQNFGIAR